MKLRFDTRDTKPKLRALVILTVAELAIVAILQWKGGARSATAICLVTAVYALGMILALLWVFSSCIRILKESS